MAKTLQTLQGSRLRVNEQVVALEHACVKDKVASSLVNKSKLCALWQAVTLSKSIEESSKCHSFDTRTRLDSSWPASPLTYWFRFYRAILRWFLEFCVTYDRFAFCGLRGLGHPCTQHKHMGLLACEICAAHWSTEGLRNNQCFLSAAKAFPVKQIYDLIMSWPSVERPSS